MKKNEQIPWSLIQKALRKSMDDTERQSLDAWLAESESNRILFEKMKLAWNVTGSEQAKKFNPDEQAAWDRIVRNSGIRDYETKKIRSLRNSGVLFFLRNAAAILFLPLLITTAVLFMRYYGPAEPAIVSVETEMGQRSHFVLEDSTKIWLNSDSRLRFATGEKRGETRIELDGEAFIESPVDRSGNLVVSTSHKDVQVVGTAFNVRAYPGENHVETVLERGRVELLASHAGETAENLAVMRPGQRAVYNKTTQMLEINEINTLEYTAWRDGVLVFRNVTFDELADRLEKWFAVQLTYDSEQFNDTRYSGTFRNRENIDQVLNTIKSTTPFEYRVINNRIIIE